MKTWVTALIPTLVASAILMTADGRSAEKSLDLKGTPEAEVPSGPRGDITTANQTGVRITFLGADGEGDGGLVLSDNTGTDRLTLQARESGGSLSTSNASGTEVINVSSSDTGGWLQVNDGSGTPAALLGVDGDGGRLSTSQPDGTQATFLGSGSGGTGVLWLSGANGSTLVSLGSSDNGGSMHVSDHSGSSKVSVGLDADGGSIILWDNADNTVVHLAALSTGGGCVAVGGSQVHDVAEVFDLETRDGVVPGTVMSVDALGSGALMPAAVPYDRKVVGVISGAGEFRHAMLIGTREDGTHDLPVALSGQVYVRVSAENGPISPGDLLVASSTAGVAMAATDIERSIGAVVGKALQAFAGNDTEGLIRMLVMAR